MYSVTPTAWAFKSAIGTPKWAFIFLQAVIRNVSFKNY